MLVLSRKTGEEILIGDNVKITINRISGDRVSIGISAPDEVRILRGELKEELQVLEANEVQPSSNSNSGFFDFGDLTSPVVPR